MLVLMSWQRHLCIALQRSPLRLVCKPASPSAGSGEFPKWLYKMSRKNIFSHLFSPVTQKNNNHTPLDKTRLLCSFIRKHTSTIITNSGLVKIHRIIHHYSFVFTCSWRTQLESIIEHFAAKEPDITLSSWLWPKTELKQSEYGTRNMTLHERQCCCLHLLDG